ncbi:hypothetical protein ACPA9J_27690 [Pseudomonas aeruginosa]
MSDRPAVGHELSTTDMVPILGGPLAGFIASCASAVILPACTTTCS